MHRFTFFIAAIVTGCAAAPTTTTETAARIPEATRGDEAPTSASAPPLEECVEPPRGVAFGVVLSCRQAECPGRYLVGAMGEQARVLADAELDSALREEAAVHGDREWLVTTTGDLDEEELHALAARALAMGLPLATACLPLPDWSVSADAHIAHLPMARELYRSGGVLGGADDPTRSREAIRTVIRANIASVHDCYEQSFARFAVGQEPRGRVIVGLLVAPDGAVVASEVSETTLGDGLTEACIEQAARRFRFEPSASGGHVVIHYPFVLERD